MKKPKNVKTLIWLEWEKNGWRCDQGKEARARLDVRSRNLGFYVTGSRYQRRYAEERTKR